MRQRSRTLAPAATLVAAGLLFACGGGSIVAVGEVAPSFELESLAGGTVDSGSLRGRPVVLNFWATWCTPCRKEMPVLEALAQDDSVQVVSIALDEDGARSVAPFVAENDIHYTVLLGDQKTFERFDGFSIPYTLVLDESQEIVNIYRGPATEQALARDLRALGLSPGHAAGGG